MIYWVVGPVLRTYSEQRNNRGAGPNSIPANHIFLANRPIMIKKDVQYRYNDTGIEFRAGQIRGKKLFTVYL